MWLSSVGLIYSARSNMNVRLNYSQTVARPTFRELAAYYSYDPTIGDFIEGNPRLTMTSIDNVTKLNAEDVYEQPVPSLDLVVSKRLGKRTTLRFAARNLLDAEIERTYGEDGNLRFSSYTKGVTLSFAVGVANTFALDAWGESLLAPVPRATIEQGVPGGAPMLENILIDGKGHDPGETNGARVVERAAGKEWQYLGLDLTAGYRSRVTQYRRGLLFVEPDLLVLHDHLVAPKPVAFRFVLHPPTVTALDREWGDLRITGSNAQAQVHAPGTRQSLRAWHRVDCPADVLLPGTVTMQMGPTNRLERADSIVVLALTRSGTRSDYAFRLIESDSAVGVRIHRQGWPTLIAFRLDAGAAEASLTGFKFQGPVGVDVFRPRRGHPWRGDASDRRGGGLGPVRSFGE
jgi:hypothetical protein